MSWPLGVLLKHSFHSSEDLCGPINETQFPVGLCSSRSICFMTLPSDRTYTSDKQG